VKASDAIGTAPGRLSLRDVRRTLGILTVAHALWSLTPAAAAAAGPLWIRLELVENTAEGPAFDRCSVESIENGNRGPRRWRVFYGEVRRASGTDWQAVRPRSGCAALASERSPDPWTLRGSPYILADVVLTPGTTSDRNVSLEASLTISTLTGFGKAGTPVYEARTEKRTLWVPAGGSTLIPVLVANQEETDAFGVRELLLRFHAHESSSAPRGSYGEIAVAADIPRASIFLDGGFVGRTSAEGPVVFGAVRTGDREVVVRDPSGREGRAVARVEKDRRAEVSLALLPKPADSGAIALRPLGRNAQDQEEFWREKDRAILVRIPGGEFRMGSAEGEGEPAQRPQHTVRLRGFLMDKTEVTWGQYRQFTTETNRPLPKAPIWGMREAFPASFVTWEEARAFCAWAGGRLPTEAEWERAARGNDARQYPWGDDWDPARCNTQEGGPHAPTAAAAYPGCVSPYGVLDLAGSMWEWCQDFYDAGFYANSPADNPAGPETGRTRVSRGGCWINPSWWVRSANRQGIDPTWPDPTRGFRCVQEDPGGAEK
jgi:formylglycine-generating enzyme required for sulfatase activity